MSYWEATYIIVRDVATEVGGVGGWGGGMSLPSNNFYVRKLVKITSKVGQNRKLVPCCKKYNKRVNFGETFFKIG